MNPNKAFKKAERIASIVLSSTKNKCRKKKQRKLYLASKTN